MNSIHRVGLAIAGVLTLITIGGAIVADGYLGAQYDAAQAALTETSATDTPSDTPVSTDTPGSAPVVVYVLPAPTATVAPIVYSNPAPVVQAAPPAAPPVTPQPTPKPTQAPTQRPTHRPTGTPGPTFGNGFDD